MASPILINEQQALACILHNPDILKNEDKNWFISPISIDLFEALKILYKQGASFTTPTVVSQALRINPDITHEIVNGLKDKIAYELKDYKVYKQRLVEDFVKNETQTRILKTVSTHLVSKNSLDLEVLKKTIKDLEWAIETAGQKNAQLKTMQTCLDDYQFELENRGKSSLFTSSGSSFLDEHLYGDGLSKGQLTTIFGASGTGKSIVALNLANGKINRQEPLLYIPTEMGEISTFDRLISMRTNTPISELTKIDPDTGGVPEYALEAFYAEKKRLSRIKYFRLVDESDLSIANVKELAQQMKKDCEVDSLTVIIDLASMLSDFAGDNKASKWEDALNLLFQLAKAENLAVVCIFQSKRPDNINVTVPDDCEKFRPHIENLKNSGAIEERSRLVLSVFRKKHYMMRLLPDDPETLIEDDILELSILKQNSGEVGTVIKYLFDAPTSKLYHYEEEQV